MAQSMQKPEKKNKCGEISAAFFEDKNEFYLNCEFCECKYLQLNDFIQHIYEDHLVQLGLFKQEATTTPLYSRENFDCYNLTSAVEENLEDDHEMLPGRHKESRDTHFETVILAPNEVEIKEEVEDNIKNEEDMPSGKKEIHNAIDVTNVDDKMLPASETPRKEKKSRTKKAKNKKLRKKSNEVDGKIKDEAADLTPQKKKKSREKKTQNPVEVKDDDGATTVVESDIDKTQNTEQEEAHNADDATNDDNFTNDDDVRNYDDITTDDDETVWAPEPQKKKRSRRKKKEEDAKPQSKHIKAEHSIIDDSQRIILAEIYKKHTCLWDEKKDIRYHFNNRRAEALLSVREEFNNKTGLNLTENGFAREIMCLRKICSKEKKNKIACKQESKEHKPLCTYYDYIEFLEVDVFPFVCSICEDQHRTLGKLKEHEATHDGSLPFKCHVCGRGFQVANYLTQHLRRHAQDQPFSCDVCKKAFTTATEVVIHMRTHTDDRPFVCYMCGLKLKTSSALIEHIMRHEQDRRFICDICSKGFVTPAQRRMHRKIHRKERDFICDICQKAFNSKYRLKKHALIHDTVKSYVCKICEKRFAQNTGLNSHMKSHDIVLTSNTTDINHLFVSPPT